MSQSDSRLKGALVISRLAYGSNSLVMTVCAILIGIDAGKIVVDFNWVAPFIALLHIVIFMTTLRMRKILVGVWGVELLQGTQEEALARLNQMEDNLIQRWW